MNQVHSRASKQWWFKNYKFQLQKRKFKDILSKVAILLI